MIILKCVQEKSKLRIKFHCFINAENHIYTNVYNNDYNCRFPKDIRQANKYYRINDTDIALTALGSSYFYTIKRKNIVTMTTDEANAILNPPPDLSTIRIFDAGDCVICLSVASNIVFLPCAHKCVCSDCNGQLKTTKYCCPVCREVVRQGIMN